jgi:hypothetical protein
MKVVVKEVMKSKSLRIFFSLVYAGCLGCSLLLTGCANNGMFRDRINDYKMVEEGPSLQFPKGIAAEARSDDYCIPDKDQKNHPENYRLMGQSIANASEGKQQLARSYYGSEKRPRISSQSFRPGKGQLVSDQIIKSNLPDKTLSLKSSQHLPNSYLSDSDGKMMVDPLTKMNDPQYAREVNRDDLTKKLVEK